MAKLASFLRCAIGVQRKFERPEQTIKTKNFRVCVGRTWIILSLAALFACFSKKIENCDRSKSLVFESEDFSWTGFPNAFYKRGGVVIDNG